MRLSREGTEVESDNHMFLTILLPKTDPIVHLPNSAYWQEMPPKHIATKVPSDRRWDY